jgi:hypothetical protein
MSRRGTETRKLTHSALVRMTAAQHRAVLAAAEAYQISVATWMRHLIAAGCKVDPGPVTIRAIPPPVILEITRLREVVAELGGVMVQASIAARQDGRDVEHDKIEALLPAIKDAAASLLTLKTALWPGA